MIILILLVFAVFFAINIGASGVAPSFCASYGAKFLDRKRIIILFTVSVIFGAVVLGYNVVKTLSSGIVPAQFINLNVALIIFIAASLSLFAANLLKIPQSTSWVTVFALVAVGLYFGVVNYKKFYILIPAWIILPTVSYFASLYISRLIYPPRKRNFVLYEKFFANKNKLRLISIFTSCYVAFAIGANNVANVVGPLKAAKIFDNTLVGLSITAPLFGLGALLFGKGNLSSLGCEIVPLGLVSSVCVSLITATLLIIASALGIPQSLVQLNAAAIFAVSHVKNGFSQTVANTTTKKTMYVWTITPLVSFGLTTLFLFFYRG